MLKIKSVKKETRNLFACVLVLTVVTLTITYGAFFDVKMNEDEQSIKSGELIVKFDGDSSNISGVLMPMSDEEGLQSEVQSLIYVQNGGSLEASFGFVLSEGVDNNFDLQYLRIAIFQLNGNGVDPTQISDVINPYDCILAKAGSSKTVDEYTLYHSTLGASGSGNSVKSYTVKFWLDENTPDDLKLSDLDLNLEVKSSVLGSTMISTFSGYVYEDSGNDYLNFEDYSLSGNHTISLNNGSYKTEIKSGYFRFENIPSGEYTLDIIKSDGTVYNETIIINEASNEELSVNLYKNDYKVSSDERIQVTAYNTKSTPYIVSIGGSKIYEINPTETVGSDSLKIYLGTKRIENMEVD